MPAQPLTAREREEIRGETDGGIGDRECQNFRVAGRDGHGLIVDTHPRRIEARNLRWRGDGVGSD